MRDAALDQLVIRLVNLAEDVDQLAFTNLTWLFTQGFQLKSWVAGHHQLCQSGLNVAVIG